MRQPSTLAATAILAWAATGCVPDAAPPVPPPSPVAERPAPPPPTPIRRTFELAGNFQQGGVVRGLAPETTRNLTLNGEAVTLANDGRFIIAFGRDHVGPTQLVATLADGDAVVEDIAVRSTEWNIQNVNASPTGGVSSASFRRRRAPELARIAAARDIRSDSQGWRQDFLWPATGRISGVFGSQRIYRGTPGSYHSGVDIARPGGTPVVAPADGVVILSADSPFTLEGNLLMLDHGMGLNSAFLHLSRIDVAEGARVRQGQTIGAIGSSGRATGPHLHWSMKWGDQRVDPALLSGPME